MPDVDRPRRPWTRRLAATALAALCSLGVPACGDDVPSKAEFTSEIGRITGGKVDSTLASCVYDTLEESESELLQRAVSTPDLSKAEDERLTQVLARCVLEEESVGTDPAAGTDGGEADTPESG